MIPAEAIEAAARAYFKDCGYAEWDHMAEGVQAAIRADMRAALEAAAPHMLAGDESKLAAIIVLLDPFERVTKWMATDDDAGRYAVEAINKIRAILDSK